MKRIPLIVLAILTGIASWSQTPAYTFKVLVSKGKTELKSGETWADLRVGASLKATDEIKVSENAYLGLIHTSGKPLEVKDAGSHRVTDLANRLSRGSSVLNKYTDFILSSEEDKRNRLSATGAVHRGTKRSIVLFIPEPKYDMVFGERIILNWRALENTKGYIVIVRNLFGEELARFETANNALELNLQDKALGEVSDYMVKVISASDPINGSEELAIRKIRSKERAEIKKELDELGAFVNEEKALNKFILAGFYEEKYLLLDAMTAYQDAIRLAPEIVQYQEQYQDFLNRIGFK
jgi:hypothetical protein